MDSSLIHLNHSSLTKRFICPVDTCRKAFTRGEHLQRHSLNHSTDSSSDNTCLRCSAYFKRADLLERHMARHRQRDTEAGGGEGSGVLNTRKRQWKDPQGNLVTSRPTKNPRARRQLSEQVETINQSHNEQSNLISPPASCDTLENKTHSYYTTTDCDFSDNSGFGNNYGDGFVITESVPHEQDLASDSFWPPAMVYPSTINTDPASLVPFHDIFNPDTASSFNMPFTTMNNYNWLFNNDLSQVETLDIWSKSAHLQTPLEQHGENRYTFLFPEYSGDSTGNQSVQTYQEISKQNENESISPELLQTNTLQPADGHSSFAPVLDMAGYPSASQCSNTNLDAPLSGIGAPDAFPIIDEFSRQQLLELIESSQATDPNGSKITRLHPLLSLPSLQTFADLFFSHFNVTYPLLHRARFDPSKVDRLLLMAVLVLGASYSSDKEAHRLAVCIHDVQRPLIFQHASFCDRPDLWVLQTILLVECFGKSRAGRKQHDMSHLFHGLLINLIRRSDCQMIAHRIHHTTGDLEDDWRAWSEAEQKKRLAYLSFMWDTQHAVLFCQSLCMSAFELQSTVPCNQSLWQADSALLWHEQRRTHKESPLFLTLLKSHLTPGTPPLLKHINGFTRVLLLHGLMSISWDMKRRDQTSLGLVSHNALLGECKWQRRMAASYDAWKADFESFCMNMMQASQNDPIRKEEVQRFNVAYNAIYHSAHIILNVDFLDLQIYAGARHILGRPVSRANYSGAKRVVQQWLKDDAPAAGRAAWHAAHLLKESIMHLDELQRLGVFHYPWCLYLANITCWAFHHARPASRIAAPADQSGTAAQVADADDADDMIWDAKAEMNSFISNMTSARPEDLAELVGRRRVDGLTAVVSQALDKVRWAVVHDANYVLRGLVPWRLINRAETTEI